MDTLRPSQDPERIGTYALLARLGAGGMGMVYLGRSPGGRLVAIKVIKDEITDHPEALTRFRREAETVRAVRSAYTANLIDASLSAPPYWLATEYVAGPTLSHAVRERGAFPADTCLRLFAALAEGLASVHGYGVTHRDLKPQNVILSPQGPQLIDFGIAKGAEDTALTRTGLAPGTPGFTAPEVLMRNQVGAAADVFALGATIAFAATGRAPFGSGAMESVSYRAVHEDIDVEGVEPGLAALIRACVAKDPADRPGAGEVIAACGVDSALVEDRFYRPLMSLGDAIPQYAVPATPAPSATPAQATPALVHDLPTAAPAQPSAHPATYVPTALGAPARRRATPWLAAGAVAVVLGLVGAGLVWWLPGRGEGAGTAHGTATPAPKASVSGAPGPTPAADTTGGAVKPVGLPGYIEQTNPSRDYWNSPSGTCGLPVEERLNPNFPAYSVTEAGSPEHKEVLKGKLKVGFMMKAYADGQVKAPYYVSLVVKPPHAIDPDTGAPAAGVLQPNLSLGYASKPVDLFAKGLGQWVEFTYPDDFTETVMGKPHPAVEVGKDPGDWTLLVEHVKGPKEYASIVCTGFKAGG
ncbi:protein kinase [Streptomyces sp. ASQP_92]|uniref:serine/threonine-protein kinase n=1 Tax=Streptomyces sp. ASQP_92 TaxID=2979116 RepID=UPI0021BEE7FB|nr:serine/threonine-protein kinase [Streptomyces sp. ASQP_92]MCT9091133.1 protein kinase [Streptomyces sp. ASQP_92]